MRHLFLTKRYLFFNLAVCCQQSPPIFLPLCVFLWPPANPPSPPCIAWNQMGRSSRDWPAQSGLSHFEWIFGVWGGAGCSKGKSLWRHGAETKALCCETIHRFPSRSIPLSRSRPGQKNPTHQCDFDRNIPTVRVCVSVCAPPLDVCTRARKKKANNTAERQATNAAAVISCNTHAHCVLSSVFLTPHPPINVVLLYCSGRSWGEVSQSVFLFVFEYCILLLFFFKLPLV